jgi:thiol-disulfide isomerase/thioredoxin
MKNENVLELDDSNWEKNVEKSDKPVFVMFYTDSCPYCKQMEPFFFEYSKEYKDKVIFARINLIQSPTITNRYSITGTPTFKFFCGGKPVQELTGAIYPTLLKKLVEDLLQHGSECTVKTTWIDPVDPGYT